MEEAFIFFTDKLTQLGYESREGQENMAFDIVEAMRDKQHILIEAGVGIGKSYAYLVPILLYNKYFKKPVIISTSSIALQEQLKEDIDKLSKLIKCYPDVVLAKGRKHFACRSKSIDYLINNSEKIKDYKEIIRHIEGGVIDRSKLPLIISNNEWMKINTDNCNRNACEYKFECEYWKYRKIMRLTTGIILTNHDMLTVNMSRKNNYEDELFDSRFELIVMDEVHNLEDKVRSTLTRRWNIAVIRRNITALKSVMRYTYSDFEEEINSLIKLTIESFKKFNLQINSQIKENSEEREMYDLYLKNIDKSMDKLSSKLDDYLLKIQLHGKFRNEKQHEIYNDLSTFNSLISNLSNENYNELYWLSRKGKGVNEVYLETCPKEVNKHIKRLYFDNSSIRTILTSATITHLKSDNPNESYSYFIKNTGFPTDESKGFLSEPKESPYPYDKHSIIYTCDHLPHPNHGDKFLSESIKEIVKLLSVTNGKTMILFTSKKNMEEVFVNLERLELPWKILKQDSSSSQSEILDSFKVNSNSVLLGTGAFWEGISIEGEALSNVIIFRLPFPVPDPIVKHKSEISKDRMTEVLLPHMIIKLKQGIGRLIRNDTDKGIITILDPRLGEKANNNYRNIVWDALPIKNRTNKLEDVAVFYNKVCKNSVRLEEANIL